MSLRILMTLDAVGGVWRYAVDLAATLADAGHEIVFAGFGPPPQPAQEEEARATARLEWSDAPLDWLASGPGDLEAAPRWLEELARRHAVDLIHLNQPAFAAGLRGGPPRVTVTHSCLATWFRTMEGGGVPDHLRWQVEATRAGFLNSDRVVAPSAAHAAMTADVYRLDDVAAVPNASRAPLVAPNDGNGQVVAAARWWDPAKNGQVLDAAAAVTAARVTMIGRAEGPDGQRFVPERVAAPIPLPHPETMERIAAASLFVSPSLYEPFGLATLEAARAGRPLLLADIPVYRQLWGTVARFFDPQDPRDLAQGIDALLRAPAERLARGAAAQRQALRYSLTDQAAAMTDIYQEVTASAVVNVTP